MEFAVRPSAGASATRPTTTVHACPQCRVAALVLQRRHVSPPRLGPTLVTEYYDCDCCDARFQYSPADNRWRPVYQ
jgi:hypothetical protein